MMETRSPYPNAATSRLYKSPVITNNQPTRFSGRRTANRAPIVPSG